MKRKNRKRLQDAIKEQEEKIGHSNSISKNTIVYSEPTLPKVDVDLESEYSYAYYGTNYQQGQYEAYPTYAPSQLASQSGYENSQSFYSQNLPSQGYRTHDNYRNSQIDYEPSLSVYDQSIMEYAPSQASTQPVQYIPSKDNKRSSRITGYYNQNGETRYHRPSLGGIQIISIDKHMMDMQMVVL